MERNENGIPVTERSGAGNNALENFFTSQGKDTRQGCIKDDPAAESAPRNRNRSSKNGDTGMDICSDSLPLAYAYVPWQKWRLLYSPSDALKNGTLFEELNKPLGVYGNE